MVGPGELSGSYRFVFAFQADLRESRHSHYHLVFNVWRKIQSRYDIILWIPLQTTTFLCNISFWASGCDFLTRTSWFSACNEWISIHSAYHLVLRVFWEAQQLNFGSETGFVTRKQFFLQPNILVVRNWFLVYLWYPIASRCSILCLPVPVFGQNWSKSGESISSDYYLLISENYGS